MTGVALAALFAACGEERGHSQAPPTDVVNYVPQMEPLIEASSLPRMDRPESLKTVKSYFSPDPTVVAPAGLYRAHDALISSALVAVTLAQPEYKERRGITDSAFFALGAVGRMWAKEIAAACRLDLYVVDAEGAAIECSKKGYAAGIELRK